MSSVPAAPPQQEFRHEAYFYSGPDELVAGCTGFLREGVAAGEPALVVLAAEKLELVRRELGAGGEGVLFADMAEVGANPARIIPAWQEFVDRHAASGVGMRGIGEPIWAGREGQELVECQGHETLLNLAFDGGPAWRLMCPYDTATLAPEVLVEAERSHPWVWRGATEAPSRTYCNPLDSSLPRLPDPPPAALELALLPRSMAPARQLAARLAAQAGLSVSRVAELTMAVNEVVENCLSHAGHGHLRAWCEGGGVVVEVAGGRIDDPLAGRRVPDAASEGARGLWLATQLCDLVQIRNQDGVAAVRLHMHRGGTGAG
ncbi:MAG TPA: MEDS domain-containing protein [Candidatus Dormibacteraeota bacterium]|jgi:anti-sigma regulatory factor (Ser/Thr protein kinase)|nr:MEDS domain-containing protein [Candidatus Dormibacteraeota bacterium]